MNTKTYTVIWTIDLEATSPEVAAELAKEIQQDPDSTATVFEVMDEAGGTVTVDTNAISVGDEVTVAPDENDYPPHEFTGTVTEIRGDEYLVEDSDGDTFNCNLPQLTKE